MRYPSQEECCFIHGQCDWHLFCFEDTSQSLQHQKRMDSFHDCSSNCILSNFGVCLNIEYPTISCSIIIFPTKFQISASNGPPRSDTFRSPLKQRWIGVPLPNFQTTRYHIVGFTPILPIQYISLYLATHNISWCKCICICIYIYTFRCMCVYI